MGGPHKRESVGIFMTVGGSSPQSDKPAPEGGARVIVARLHESFTIHLWEDRTRGEQWVPSYDHTALSLVNDEYLRIASNNAVDTGRRSFEFQSVCTGSHRLVFEKRMGWKFTAEDRRVFMIDTAA